MFTFKLTELYWYFRKTELRWCSFLTHCKCRWKGYDKSDDTWEPASNFTDPKFITEYWQRVGIVPEDIKYRYDLQNNKGKSNNVKLINTSHTGKRKTRTDLNENSHSSTTSSNKVNGNINSKRSRRY